MLYVRFFFELHKRNFRQLQRRNKRFPIIHWEENSGWNQRCKGDLYAKSDAERESSLIIDAKDFYRLCMSQSKHSIDNYVLSSVAM